MTPSIRPNPNAILRIAIELATCASVFTLPLVGSAKSLAHPAPWTGFLAWFVVLRTQPPLVLKRVAVNSDRWSALGILATVAVSQLTAVLEFRLDRRPSSLLLLGTGTALVLVGLPLRFWAIRTLGRFFTATVEVQRGQKVIRDGPYRLLRHPSYTAAIVIAFAVTTVLGSSLGAALVMGIVLPAYLYRIRVEERLLAAELGDDYRQYQRISWRLIPRVF